jgi:hypothetical protein
MLYLYILRKFIEYLHMLDCQESFVKPPEEPVNSLFHVYQQG